ncbi:MAG: hypothetical protein DMF59_20155 [Acidobacteria bacterium]|nr:MAG: hypothetical protein DMF59_20155 [Acidobacteriota bacterium]
MPRVRIVLVEPQEAGNVGAVARVMKNFGFEELWIVGEYPKLDPVAGWWASGAEDVIAKARRVATLHHAIGDAQSTSRHSTSPKCRWQMTPCWRSCSGARIAA